MKRTLLAVGALAVLVAGIAGPARPSGAASPPLTRYSLVHGCYSLQSSGTSIRPEDGPYRMQATTLGEYLLYGVHDDFLTDSASGIAVSSAPSRAAEWRVDGAQDTGFTLTNLGTGTSRPVTFGSASGCAVYPEAQVDASGHTFRGDDATGPVTGTIDGHTHTTAFEFLGGDWHCGRPWHPYGVAYALPDCQRNEQGTNGAFESFLDYGSPAHPHDTKGWPTFHDWPARTALAEEGEYWTGLQRAWLAGLRIMVVHLVDNEALCLLMTTRHNPCNDMQSVEIQARDLRALQDYIDAQAGGPGMGFFRIVTDPAQARAVINEGKLAVVMGIEVSDLFNCGEFLNLPKCSTSQINSWLDRVWSLGVRTFFPIHKFDNAFGGTKMDGGETGVIVNIGNRFETGSFWDVHTCTGPEHDQPQLTAVPDPVGSFISDLSSPLNAALGGAVVPVYPPEPHCNVRGLTSLGAYLVRQMIKRHFIIELDHMDAKSGDQTLDLLEAAHYSGVVSGHSWDSPEQNPRIYALGGFITPMAGSADGFVQKWQQARAIRDPRYPFGIGYGSDMNGLAEQGGPATHPIAYPFHSYAGGVTFDREQWGQRTFDLNTDGVANYGLYADWLQELQVLGGPQLMDDMFHGAEAYLDMWQRAAAH